MARFAYYVIAYIFFAILATVASGNTLTIFPVLARTARYTYIIYAMFAFLTFRLT